MSDKWESTSFKVPWVYKVVLGVFDWVRTGFHVTNLLTFLDFLPEVHITSQNNHDNGHRQQLFDQFLSPIQSQDDVT